jgi:hypothetical protein
VTDDLSIRRVERQPDNKKVNPIDLLKKVIHDIETGEIKADAILILPLEITDGAWTRTVYRAGLSVADELTLLSLSHRKTMDWWMGVDE